MELINALMELMGIHSSQYCRGDDLDYVLALIYADRDRKRALASKSSK